MTEQQLARIEAQLTQNKRAGFCGMWLDIADVRGLIADCRRLEEMLAAERQRADKAEVALSQVDDVLIVDWINVVDGNYRKALADLVAYNITIHDDPAVSEVAAKRQVAIQQAERERDEARAELAAIHEALDAVFPDWSEDGGLDDPPLSAEAAIREYAEIHLRLYNEACKGKYEDK